MEKLKIVLFPILQNIKSQESKLSTKDTKKKNSQYFFETVKDIHSEIA